MSNRNSPEISVVIVTPDCYKTIHKAMQCLRAQTVSDRMEIIIVAPSTEKLGIDVSEIKGFFNICVIEAEVIKSTAVARARGIHQASAPIAALTEDHTYPDPGWAEALIKTHRQPWAVVGPVIGNANPHTMISWANLLIEYNPWLEPAAGGAVRHLPGHNSSYKREVLVKYGSNLETMLGAESVLHWDLQAKGYGIYLEPAAKTYHLNFSHILPSLLLRFYCGRLFAATRARSWSPLHKLLYIGGAPLIPIVRLWRIIRELCKTGRRHSLLPRILPLLTFLLVCATAGEMMGYAFGAGKAIETLSDLEFRHLYSKAT